MSEYKLAFGPAVQFVPSYSKDIAFAAIGPGAAGPAYPPPLIAAVCVPAWLE